MAGFSASCVAFKSTNANCIPLTMDIKENLFVEVSNHILVMKFKLHVHLFLMERKLHDSDSMVIDAILQWLQHFCSSKVWKVLQGIIKFMARTWDHPPNSQMLSQQLLPLMF